MKEKIKVAEFVSRLEFGGVESVILNYISHFANLDDFDFHIVTQDINDSKCIEAFEKAGFTVHVVIHKRKSMLKNLREIFRVLFKEKFDVVHTHMTMTNFYVLIMARVLRVPVRISHSHMATNDSGVEAKWIEFVLKKLNKLPANIWMACGYDAGVFLFGKKDVDNGKVEIIKNAIDLNQFLPNEEKREQIRTQYEIGKRFCIGHIGRFMIQKNHEFVIEVFKEFLKLKPDSVLLLVGDGELRGKVYEQVISLGIEKNVIFTGNVTNINELYQVIDVFILPSFYEGLPVVSIEAQAAGLPCFISDRVDKRCALTQEVEFLSIDTPAEGWAKEILRYAENRKQYLNERVLTDAGYNIEIEAKKLEQIYKGWKY